MDIVGRKIWDDTALIIAFKEGNREAFSHLFEKFYNALCFFTRNITADADHAEDIVQEVFFKLWHKHADFVDLPAIKAFLYISCKNASLNYLEKEKNKGSHQRELLRVYGETEDFVLNEIIYSESLREISIALDELPEQCAAVMKLLFQEGLKPQEVATELGITVSTVYNQKSKGISILKERLSLQSFALLAIMLSDKFVN
ncbi:RNA polymerase sigma-70 factor [Pedobacter sp. PWIIR3]